MWRCTVCQKEHKSKTLIRDHVEVAIFSKDLTLHQVKAQHFKNIDYSCDHCGKVYKTRDSFKKHVAVHKRNPGFFGRGAYNSSKGEEREIVTGPGYDFEDGQENYENTDIPSMQKINHQLKKWCQQSMAKLQSTQQAKLAVQKVDAV